MIEKFPELESKTIQKIFDQKRQLFLKYKFPNQVIQNIRREAVAEIEITTVTAPSTTEIKQARLTHVIPKYSTY